MSRRTFACLLSFPSALSRIPTTCFCNGSTTVSWVSAPACASYTAFLSRPTTASRRCLGNSSRRWASRYSSRRCLRRPWHRPPRRPRCRRRPLPRIICILRPRSPPHFCTAHLCILISSQGQRAQLDGRRTSKSPTNARNSALLHSSPTAPQKQCRRRLLLLLLLEEQGLCASLPGVRRGVAVPEVFAGSGNVARGRNE